MNNLFCYDFTSVIGVKTLVIVIISSALSLIVKHAFKCKSATVNCYLPLLISLLLEFLYHLFFISKEVKFSNQLLSSGMLSGSISTAITVFISKLINGKKVSANPIILTITGLLEGNVSEDKIDKCAKLIAEVYLANKSLPNSAITALITEKLEKDLELTFEGNTFITVIVKMLKVSY